MISHRLQMPSLGVPADLRGTVFLYANRNKIACRFASPVKLVHSVSHVT